MTGFKILLKCALIVSQYKDGSLLELESTSASVVNVGASSFILKKHPYVEMVTG